MNAAYVISPADTASPERLAENLEAIFRRMHPGAECDFIAPLVRKVRRLFEGGDPRYLAIDMAYHDFEHTLQTALCLARMMEGRALAGVIPPMTPSDFRRALAAMLYHDTGYLKGRDDAAGTGAKYTFVHERRSADLAVTDLRSMGWAEDELSAIRLFILCTGPSARPDRQPFGSSVDAELGAMVCTADFLGQMSDPLYLEKLPALYREFEEAYATRGMVSAMRPFSSADDLLSKTPAFWRNFVLPKLTEQCGAVFRHLARPPGAPSNPYLEAVGAHLRRLCADESPGAADGVAR